MRDSEALARLCPDDPAILANYAGAVFMVAMIQNPPKEDSLNGNAAALFPLHFLTSSRTLRNPNKLGLAKKRLSEDDSG